MVAALVLAIAGLLARSLSPVLVFECPSPQALAAPGKAQDEPAARQEQARLLSTDLQNGRVGAVVEGLRSRYPGAQNAPIVDYLIAAYCPAVARDPGLGENEKQARIDRFAAETTRVDYGSKRS